MYLAKNMLQKNILNEIFISNDETESLFFWQFRKEISSSLKKYNPYKFDISVLPSNISQFLEMTDRIFKEKYPELETVWFGHVGDGNLHLNILNPEKMSTDEFFLQCNPAIQDVYALVQKFKGSVCAEHGVGLLKKRFLHYSKNAVEINYMSAIKKIFDPNNIMNPGKLI